LLPVHAERQTLPASAAVVEILRSARARRDVVLTMSSLFVTWWWFIPLDQKSDVGSTSDWSE
jgi:hypothetical protein